MAKKQKTVIHTGVQCPRCGDKIFSLWRHDYHLCSCGLQSVDGGVDYLHYSLSEYAGKKTKLVKKKFKVHIRSKAEMFAQACYLASFAIKGPKKGKL